MLYTALGATVTQEAFDDHSVMLAFLKLEPLLQPFQSDPRWNDLERRLGISK